MIRFLSVNLINLTWQSFGRKKCLQFFHEVNGSQIMSISNECVSIHNFSTFSIPVSNEHHFDESKSDFILGQAETIGHRTTYTCSRLHWAHSKWIGLVFSTYIFHQKQSQPQTQPFSSKYGAEKIPEWVNKSLLHLHRFTSHVTQAPNKTQCIVRSMDRRKILFMWVDN